MEIKIPSSFKDTKHSPLVKWLLEGHLDEPEGPYAQEKPHTKHKVHPWWQVMCLTGVDYFSTLGYQPFIAFEAAKYLSPFATIILVLLTVFGAYPVYAKVSQHSPHGEGSIAMLQRLLTWWQGKAFVLVLLGFAATDFIITITLSAADAAVHLIENAYVIAHSPLHLHGHEVSVTLLLVISLSAVFLKGFKEAVGIAVVLVIAYLSLNAVVIVHGLQVMMSDPVYLEHWRANITKMPETHGGNPIMILAVAAFLFPKLALGLSGFETGVSVMTLVKGSKRDTEEHPVGRIKNTRKLLISAALIMSVALICSSLITTTLIPSFEYAKGGQAYERALAYLAYKFYGPTFGTVYDISTILILWFAGASAMAGLLNLVPRYLPKFGMAPEWTKANRPLVLIFTAISFAVTLIFKASVSAQGGAYATGVLMLMTSAAVAATISTPKKKRAARWGFGVIATVFIYTTIVNVYEKPDGIRIAAFFILGIVLVSFVSRIWRTLELRVSSVELDLKALEFVRYAATGSHIRIIPNRPEGMDRDEYERKEFETRRDHDIAQNEPILFVEVRIEDASNFTGALTVRGYEVEGYKVLRATGVAVPNSLAALLLHLGQLSGKRAHAYFNWGERGPASYLMKFLFSGEGDIAPLTREILRRCEADINLRPVIHAAS
jgi:hypothetical protein